MCLFKNIFRKVPLRAHTEDKQHFFVISYHMGIGYGIGAIAQRYLGPIQYIIKMGGIPIIDMQHSAHCYFKSGDIFHKNAWEYFFEQPCGVSLNDIKPDSRVDIIWQHINSSAACIPEDIPVSEVHPLNEKQIIAKKNFKRYIRPNKILLKHNMELEKQVIPEGVKHEEILGVLCRGTDIGKGVEWIQPSIDQMIENIKTTLHQNSQLKYIYCATEDQIIYDTLKKEFGDKLLNNPQYKYKEIHQKFLISEPVARKNHHYHLAMEYLSSLLLLSKCSYFIGGRCNGSLLVWYWGNFKKFNVPHLGYGRRQT